MAETKRCHKTPDLPKWNLVPECAEVMEAQMPREKGLSEEPQALEPPVAVDASLGRARLRVGGGGRIVIPAEMRAALLIKPGDTVTAEVVDGEFRIVDAGCGIEVIR
jgi:AbrB family looped-hinge helix DNA binding protein